MNRTALTQRELFGEKLWKNYLTNAKTQFQNLNQVTFLNNFWANYDQLIASASPSDAFPASSTNSTMFKELFHRYWDKPLHIHQGAQRQVKRKLTQTLWYALLGIILIFYPRAKASLKDQKNKVATYVFHSEYLQYQPTQKSPKGSLVNIPYNKIHNLWYHREGRLIAGNNAQVQWFDQQGHQQHQIMIPGSSTQEWSKVRTFLSEVAQYNMQLDT